MPNQVGIFLASGAEAETEIICRGQALDLQDLVDSGDDSAYSKS